MNDLSTLKRAMDAPPDYTPSELDLGAIVREGRRLRLLRRLAVGSASAAAVVTVLVGGSQFVPGVPGSGRDTASAPSSAPSSTPAQEPATVPYGSVIETGLPAGGGVWVLYAVRISDVPLSGTPFGIMLGVRTSTGQIEPSVEINETEGSTLAPGFHQGEAAQNLDGRDTPAFGYYVGKPYRIAAKVRGGSVSAHLEAWSEDPSVTVFWFSPADAGPGDEVTGLTAYDRHGEKMVAGKPSFGVG